MKMIAEREATLHEAGARITAAKVTPAVIDQETRRIEEQARAKLADVRALLTGSPEDGRRALEALLDGPLKVEPTKDGTRFRLTGRAVLGPVDLTEEAGGTQDRVYRRGRPYVEDLELR